MAIDASAVEPGSSSGGRLAQLKKPSQEHANTVANQAPAGGPYKSPGQIDIIG